jgi:trichoplein keratin filament-binding protein
MNTTKYFNSTNVQSAQHNQWTSMNSFNNSMNAYTRQMEKTNYQGEEKKIALQARQAKLKALLQKELSSFESELKGNRLNGKDNQSTLDSLKLKVDQIRSAKERDRKKLAEEKIYQLWRQNNPELRELESLQLNNHVAEQWKEQTAQKQEALKLAEQEESEYLKYLELEKQKAEDLDLELKRLKLDREVELKEILKQQMIELKQRESETEILNREESELMREKLEIQKLEEERQIVNEKIAKQEYGRQLLRQHKAKMRKKAKDIQEALELDLKIMQMLNDSYEKRKHLESAKRLQAKADTEKMIQVLNQQLRLEREREAELEAMFQDEAAKEWERRNEEWEKERIARETLMSQVMNERQRQIEEKFLIVKEKIDESLQKREELINDMEKAEQLLIKEKKKMELLKLENKLDLEAQISLRKEKLLDENLIDSANFYEQDQIEQQKQEEFLKHEKEKQLNAGFAQKVSFLIK